jgi:hypothetical protein
MLSRRLKLFAIGGIMLLLTVMFIGWTFSAQWRAKNWGGTFDVKVEAGHKFINATWKDADLWILSRPAKEGETFETEPYIFKESSALGIQEGTVKIYEQPPK